MTNREKVIKEFELFIKEFHPACTSEGVELDMFREVLALLKEQEDLGTELTNAVELIHKKNERIKELLKEQEPKSILGIADSIEGIEVGKCPRCERTILSKQNDPTQYCKYCGQAVKWE